MIQILLTTHIAAPSFYTISLLMAHTRRCQHSISFFWIFNRFTYNYTANWKCTQIGKKYKHLPRKSSLVTVSLSNTSILASTSSEITNYTKHIDISMLWHIQLFSFILQKQF